MERSAARGEAESNSPSPESTSQETQEEPEPLRLPAPAIHVEPGSFERILLCPGWRRNHPEKQTRAQPLLLATRCLAVAGIVLTSSRAACPTPSAGRAPLGSGQGARLSVRLRHQHRAGAARQPEPHSWIQQPAFSLFSGYVWQVPASFPLASLKGGIQHPSNNCGVVLGSERSS